MTRRLLPLMLLSLCAAGCFLRGLGAGPPPRLFLYAQSDVRLRVFAVDGASGLLTPADDGVGIESARSPIYLAVHPGGRALYAASDSGQVTAYEIDQATGNLRPITGTQSARAPCYVNVHPDGKHLLTANYGGATWVAPILPDLRAGEGTAHETGPTTHSARFHPGGKFAYTLTVAAGKITQWVVGPQGLSPNTPATITRPGWGPRHIAFAPDGRIAYVVHERPVKVGSFAVGAGGGLTAIEEHSALRPGTGEDTDLSGAEIAVAPSGRFVYASVRNPKRHLEHNGIAIFAALPGGKLRPAGFVPTNGAMPRGFVLDPRGDFLFAANEQEGRILTFRVDADGGHLTQVQEARVAPRTIGLAVVALPPR